MAIQKIEGYRVNIDKERVERILVSPGWFRLWKVLAGTWWVGTFIGLLNKGLEEEIIISFIVPLIVYLLCISFRWIIRGFME